MLGDVARFEQGAPRIPCSDIQMVEVASILTLLMLGMDNGREHMYGLFHSLDIEQHSLLTPQESWDIGWMVWTVYSTALGPARSWEPSFPIREDGARLLVGVNTLSS